MTLKPLMAGLAVALLSACATQPQTSEEAHDHAHHHGPTAHRLHRHDSWPALPVEYTNLRSDRWADLRAIARGETLYRRHCQSCHGTDGRGDGPAASALPHPPADLTHHFHKAPGDGDGYLFWRVSEGGAVEPFRSQGSAMPAFKDVLNVNDRWDVLAYVHAYFHLGLAEWKTAGGPTDASGTKTRSPNHSEGG